MAEAYDNQAKTLVYTTIGHVLQTLFFGIYATLMPVAIYTMLRRGIRSLARRVLFYTTIFCFFMSAVFWALSMASLMDSFGIIVVDGRTYPDELSKCSIRCVLTVFDAIVLVNYAITDGVVVWRAWVLCKDSLRKPLYVAIGLLGITYLALFGTIILRLAILIIESKGHDVANHQGIARGLDITQVATLVFTFLTNLVATSIVSRKAWQNRRWLMSIQHGSVARSERILTLLIESGFLYCFSTLFVLISVFIPLPVSTLGNLYQPINIQIAGMYPLIVIIAIDKQRSMKQTDAVSEFSSSRGARTMPWRVASPPNFSSHVASGHTHYTSSTSEDYPPFDPYKTGETKKLYGSSHVLSSDSPNY